MTLKEKLLTLDIVIDNDYLRKYVELIESNRETKRENFKTQKHHIIPRYYYKNKNLAVDNSEDNCVNLKYVDHILAHYYLCLCSKDEISKWCNSLAIKYCLNCSNSPIHLSEEEIKKMFPLIQEIYEFERRITSIQNSGFKHTSEARKKISEASAGCRTIHKDNVQKRVKEFLIPVYLDSGWKLGGLPQTKERVENRAKKLKGHVTSKETREKISKTLMGHLVSEETRKKSSLSQKGKPRNNKGKIYINKDGVVKNIFKEELDMYLNNGWLKGNPNAITYGTKNTIWMNDGIKNYMIKKNLEQKYIEKGFVYGRIKKN